MTDADAEKVPDPNGSLELADGGGVLVVRPPVVATAPPPKQAGRRKQLLSLTEAG